MSLRLRFALLAFALGLLVVLVTVRWSFERNLREIQEVTRTSHDALTTEVAELAREALYHEDHGTMQLRLAALVRRPEITEGMVWNAEDKVVAASSESLLGAPRPPQHGKGWVVQSLSDLGGADLGGLALRFSDKALEMANRRAERDGFVIALAGMLGFSVIAFFLGSALTGRLKKLSIASGRLAKGDKGVRSGVSGRDEIGQLARSFDIMATELEAEGIRLNEEIEERRSAEQALLRRESALSALTLMTATRANSENPIDALLQLLAAECHARVVGLVHGHESAWQTLYHFPDGQTLTEGGLPIWGQALSEQEVKITSPSPGAFESAIPIVTQDQNFGVLVIEGAQCADAEFLALVGRWLTGLLQREALQKQLIENERMVSIGTLSSGIAHEINNPLTVIIGGISLAQRILGADRTEVQEHLDSAMEGAERCSSIIDSLKTLSRPSREVELDLVDPKVAIETAARNAEGDTTGKCRVTQEVGALPKVLANETLLSQVLLNLITNAAHAIESGSVEENEIRIDTWADGPMLAIRIKDTGTGIDPAHLHRVMDPFFTTKSPGQGTGLGLYLCHQIVGSFGGTLAIESALLEGTTMILRVPIAPQQGGRIQGRGIPTSQARLRVLIVDDTAMILQIARKALEGHEVVTAADHDTALAIARSEEFDCIVSDVRMPGGSGLDLFDVLRKEELLESTNFAFMTGGVNSLTDEARLAETSCRVLEKPFTPEALRTFVEEGAVAS